MIEKNRENLASFRRAYYSFVAVFLVLFTLSQLFLFFQYEYFSNNSVVINIAGRQRMLSQSLVKNLFIYRQSESSENEIKIRQNLVEIMNGHEALLYRDGRFGIRGENTKEVKRKLKLLTYYLNNIKDDVRCILGDNENCNKDSETYIGRIIDNERLFLNLMDNTVYGVTSEFKGKVRNTQTFAITSYIFFIIVFIASGSMIFYPFFDNLKKYYEKISRKKEEALMAFSEAEVITLTKIVSHEINRFVTSGYLKLDALKRSHSLDDDEILADVNRSFEEIESISNSMSVTTNVQNLSNLDIFNISDVIEDCAAVSEDILNSNSIKLIVENVDKELFARGYQNELSQVLINSVTTSLRRLDKFSNKWIKLTGWKTPTNEVVIEVSDSSYGLDFESDGNLSSSDQDVRKREFRTWLSKKILEKQNGRLEYDYSQTHTSLKIYLPAPGSEYNIRI